VGRFVLPGMSVVRDPDPGGQPGVGGSDEAALVAQALTGDHEALGVLVTRYAPSVRRVTRAILGDVAEADDAAQDGFLLALLKLDQFDRTRAFGPWLMRVVTNAAIDRGRRRRIRSTRPLEDDVAASTPLPDVQVERRALGERLQAALAQLPERYRTAIVLFDVEGYSHAEIAAMLGVARGTVRSAVFHARRRLRRLLADWREGA
jgi:RNA polymerase sigma factor (sigma-70 family)